MHLPEFAWMLANSLKRYRLSPPHGLPYQVTMQAFAAVRNIRTR